MKKLLKALIIICVVSFTGFWVSTGIFGTTGYMSYTRGSVVEQVVNSATIFSELATSDKQWEIPNEYPNVNINTAGATTIIEQNDDNKIIVSAQIPGGRKLFVGAYCNRSTQELTIEVRPENITFADVVEEFGKVLWSEDVFSFPEGVVVTISFPHTIYGELNIKQGSGKLYVDEIYSNHNSIEIGSGKFEMQRTEQFTSDSFSVSLGSGSATIKNMRSDGFNINVGSGSFAFTGVSGSGSVDMGSGKGSLVLAGDCQDVDLDMGSGSIDVYVEESGIWVASDVASGSLNIDAYGTSAKIRSGTDEESVYVGRGNTDSDATLFVELASGSVNILEAANAPALVINIPETRKSAVSSSSSSTDSSNPEVAYSSSSEADAAPVTTVSEAA